MATAAAHPIAWQAPRPLWRGATPFAQVPQILRFASDEFMEQLIATLEEDPAALSQLVARPETWRTPTARMETADLVQRVPLPAPIATAKRKRLLGASRPAAPPEPPADDQPLKLYQPAHMRHYVVAASLACVMPGLPERVVAGDHERVGFVLRRLLPHDPGAAGNQTKREFAFVKTGGESRWQRVVPAGENPAVLAPGEELLPLFRLAHRDELARPRGLWAGVVPVGRREEYLSKGVDRNAVPLTDGQEVALRPPQPATPASSKTARLTRFKMEVAEPWKGIIRAAAKTADEFDNPADLDDEEDPAKKIRRRLDFNLQWQMQSWLILLDMSLWLEEFLPRVWDAVEAQSSAGLVDNELLLYQRLEAANAAAIAPAMGLKPMAATLAAALLAIRQPGIAVNLEKATIQYGVATSGAPDWPPFHFPLAGLDGNGDLQGPYAGAIAGLDPNVPIEGDLPNVAEPPASPGSTDIAESLDAFTALVGRALVAGPETDVQPLPFALKLRDAIASTAGDEGLFLIRFVHINRDCGPLHPPTVSAPSQIFRMANFFDSDAPVRPVRISLPGDTSPAGLRKHGRGTAFVLSDMLCGQVQRAKGLGFIDLVRQVLPWPLHKDIQIGDGGACKNGSTEIGMICSLSIPIVTLCALILMLIIVSLLDFIFRWLPWLIFCFPVPGLKGKKP